MLTMMKPAANIRGHRLDDGEITFVYRGYEQAPEPGQDKYLLHDHRAASR